MTQHTIQRCRVDIEGMDCPGCAATIERGLISVPGITDVSVNFLEGRADVAYETATVSEQDITDTVNRLGYTPRRSGSDTASQVRHGTHRSRWPVALMGLSGSLTGLAMLFSWFVFPAWSIRLICALAIVTGGVLASRKAVAALRGRSLDMNVLMTIAIIGAMLIGEWTEGAMVAFLFALANYLEARSMGRARQAIQSVMTMAPRTALVVRDGHESPIPVEQIRVGDIVIVKPGEQIPIDGTVLEGHSSVNQAPITGESVPVEKQGDDTVFAGTINGEGALTLQTTTLSNDTTLARIVRLVEEAQARQAPVQRFVDRFARIYTPIVVILAVLVAFLPPLLFQASFTDWVYRALVLLVISCPCALVISTPVAIVSALTTAARHGVLIKGGLYLEQLGALHALAFDKTGTLSQGHPSVTDVVPMNGIHEDDLLMIAASIESRSEHPIARAITEYAQTRQIVPERVTRFSARPGSGAHAVLKQGACYVGNHRFFATLNLTTPEIDRHVEDMQRQGKTVVLVGSETESLGLIALMDQARMEATLTMGALRREGITSLTMLTGDNAATAQRLADQIGMDAYRSDLLPDEKVTAIQALVAQYGAVGMVGDGVNDAPALATATVGIAMGTVGTAMALETADVVLMRDDLSTLASTIRLSRKTRAIIFQNIVTAILLKVFFLLLTLLGLATLWMAVIADMGASLLVIFNGLRLLRNRMD